MIKDLGPVSTYAYAVEKGYTGTEEEFELEQAGFAQNAQKVSRRIVSRSNRIKMIFYQN